MSDKADIFDERPARFSPAHEGGDQLDRFSPAHEGGDQLDRFSPAHKGANQLDRFSPAHEGANQLDRFSPAHEGANQLDRFSPAHEGGDQLDRFSPAHEGGDQLDRFSPAHEGGDQLDRFSTAHEGRDQLDRFSPAHEGRDQLDRFSPAHEGRDQLDRFSPAHEGRDQLDRFSPAHEGGDQLDICDKLDIFDKFREECGVIAVHGHPEAANIAYLGLYALQHRGQESAGIASSDGREIHTYRGMGRVADLFTPEVLGGLTGEIAIGHTRYSTAGDTALLNAQPFSVACNKGRIAVAHNGNITNAAELRRELESEGSIFQSSSDTEVILHLVARSRERTLSSALREALLQLEGAFSLVFLAKDRILVARDPHGFRPLAFGQMELSGGRTCYVFGSETCAFDLIDAVYLNDVEPGEMVVIGPEGMTRERYAPIRPHAHCVFEHVYFSRPDSIVFGRPVAESREMLGRLLAREHPVEADIVVPVPDSGVAAAVGYANEAGIPFHQALIRSHYVGRTFIEPSQAIRDFGVKLKFNPVRHLLEGRRVVLVDDSIVRGTVARKIVRMVRNAGAREVHLRISCPPTVSPCFYGVDTPRKAELIAANNSIEEIRWFVEADSLGYLSLSALRRAVSDNNHDYCYACYTGDYPTELVNIDELMAAGDRR